MLNKFIQLNTFILKYVLDLDILQTSVFLLEYYAHR